MVVVELSIHEVAEKSFPPQTTQIPVRSHVRIVLKQIVDFAGFFDGFDQFDTLCGSEERGDFAEDMLARVQRPDGVLGMVGKKRGYLGDVEVLAQEFFIIGRHECIGIVFQEFLSHPVVVVATGYDFNVEELAET